MAYTTLTAGSCSGCASGRARRLSSLVLLGALLSCQQQIRMAYLGPLTGPESVYGKLESQAAQLAVLDFNAQNTAGKTAQLLLVDTARVSTTGLISRLRRKHRIQAIVGPPSSDLAKALVDQLESHSMVMVSASASNPQLTFKNPWFFRLQPSDEQQSEIMALFLVQKLQKTRTAVLYSAGHYGTPLARNFIASYQHAGGSIVEEAQEITDPEWQLKQLKQLQQAGGQMDALYLAADLEDAKKVLPALAGMGGVTVVGSDAFSKGELRPFAELNGVYYATAALRPQNRKRLQRMLRDYQASFRSQPDIFAINAYDASSLLLDVIDRLQQKKGMVDGQDIRQALTVLQAYQGVGGDITFGARGEVERGMSVYQFSNGKPKHLGSFLLRGGKLVSAANDG